MGGGSQVRGSLNPPLFEASKARRVVCMSRRAFCGFLAGSTGLLRAQPAAKVYRLGILWHADSREGEGPAYTAVLTGLHERGWVEGSNIAIEHRFAAEKPERFRSLATELVALTPDALLGVSNQSAVALKNTGTTIPIVFTAVGDPVGLGLVQSLGRPGANITGYTIFASELIPKRLQLLVELLPRSRQVGVLFNPDSPAATRQASRVVEASQANDIAIVPIGARDAAQIDAAIAQFAERGIKSMLTLGDPLFWFERTRIANAALARGIAEESWMREGAAAGSLFSYGVNVLDVARQSTEYVTRVLKGTPPSELPVVEPTRFELLVNLKTAKALGINLPPAFLLRADEVVQ
jgi:putative tryptophan/tyrosine transport system substrate-binding protein